MPTPSDLDTAYADALRGDRGDVHLLRLIQKTGPVWGKLAPHTCKSLLAVFIKHVKVRVHAGYAWHGTADDWSAAAKHHHSLLEACSGSALQRLRLHNAFLLHSVRYSACLVLHLCACSWPH
jgi:hypothetical protein